MKRTLKNLLLLALVVALFGTLVMGVSANELGDPDAALEYLDCYSDNVAADENRCHYLLYFPS